jgi:hypothetical protein
MSNNAIRSYLQENHEEMVEHIARLTSATVEEVCEEFAGNYSILIPMLAGVTGPPSPAGPPRIPSPTLQYPDRTEDEEDEGQWTLTHSPPLLMIPPRAEEVDGLITLPPPVSPLPPYADLPFEGTDIPSSPTSPVPPLSAESSTTDWSQGLNDDKENWEPQPSVHPGPGWECNFERDLVDFPHAPRHFFTIPDGKGGQELAPFVRYCVEGSDPFLEACRGFNCDVFSRPLHARLDQEYCAPLTPHQEWFFEPDQDHTMVINWALRSERDMTLTAEVHRAHHFCIKYKKAADDLVRLRAVMDSYKYQHKKSLRRIARADGYQRLCRTIESGLIIANGRAGGLMATEILEGKRFVRQAQIANDHHMTDRCRWCDQRGHLAYHCKLLQRCTLCNHGGHTEEDCRHPHANCNVTELCLVHFCHPFLRANADRCGALEPALWPTEEEMQLSEPMGSDTL